jgi:hypothetical protein
MSIHNPFSSNITIILTCDCLVSGTIYPQYRQFASCIATMDCANIPMIKKDIGCVPLQRNRGERSICAKDRMSDGFPMNRVHAKRTNEQSMNGGEKRV